MAGLGDARHGLAEGDRDRPVPHVVEVGNALGQVIAAGQERLPIPGQSLVDGVRGRAPGPNLVRHRIVERGIVGHERLVRVRMSAIAGASAALARRRSSVATLASAASSLVHFGLLQLGRDRRERWEAGSGCDPVHRPGRESRADRQTMQQFTH